MSFASILKDLTNKAPELAIEPILRKKLKKAGVKAWRAGARALAHHLIHKDNEEFHWEDYPLTDSTDSKIVFTKDDGRELEEVIDKLPKEIEAIAEQLISSTVDRMLADYKMEWQTYRRRDERFVATFRNNLEDRWGEALDGLRLLLDLSRDEGQKFHLRLGKTKAKSSPYSRIVLSKLHARACQVTAEILALLEAGFANGALARWRTLHEIEVVATLISEADNATAERYLDYEFVESKKAMDQFELNYEDLGYAPLTKKQQADINADYYRVIEKYGKNFGGSYGWAAEYLENKSPRFTTLEEAAGAARMRSHYKFASYNVHASAKALSMNMDSLGYSTWPFAGATNAGLDEPGQNTAITILRITYLLTQNLRSVDNAIILSALVNLRDDTVAAFVECADELAQDEYDIQSAVTDYEIEINTRLI